MAFQISFVSWWLGWLIDPWSIDIPDASCGPYRPDVGLGPDSGSSVVMGQVVFENSADFDFVIRVHFDGLLFGFIECLLDDHGDGYA